MSEATVRLSPALKRFVDAQVKEGNYGSREAVILAAVDRERRRTEQLAWLQREVQKGVDALDQGRVVPFDPEAIKRRGRARLARRRAASKSHA